MHLEVKSFIKIPPEKKELDINQEYPGFIKMTDLKDNDVFNYAFGRGDGYPSGKVVFYINDEQLPFNEHESELYMFWHALIKSVSTSELNDVEESNWSLQYESEEVSSNFIIRFFYQKKVVEFYYKNKILSTFPLDIYKKAVLQGFLDFMWHTNLEFETIMYDSLGEEIDYASMREDTGDDLYTCRYIFLQFMKEIYRQKKFDVSTLIDFDFKVSRSFSRLKYDLED
ncbi:hypothetical protein ITJ88_02195 [Exiguobacterium sp. TBG-PICH-001]|uniref:hypothetical protein n=1 Tax=Exiguobacterium abrahamii TaxID=2785532 RepID=UPI0018A7A83F|nr:hypothetical protein [Exiguobacterium sp. TBG-PICH-001]MBF8152081.1 hypothetical protein [Exiguobacterium sp. TBG-PICH-001]